GLEWTGCDRRWRRRLGRSSVGMEGDSAVRGTPQRAFPTALNIGWHRTEHHRGRSLQRSISAGTARNATEGVPYSAQYRLAPRGTPQRAFPTARYRAIKFRKKVW